VGYAVAKLLEEHGDARLTDLLHKLTDCPRRGLQASMIVAKLCTRGLLVRKCTWRRL
jgi:hypothetical protein